MAESTIATLELIYANVPIWLVATSLMVAWGSLIVRWVGLRKGILIGRPWSLVGLLVSVGCLAMFYVSLLIPGAPQTAAARGGIVRMLLIALGVSMVCWDWDYITLAIRGWRIGK